MIGGGRIDTGVYRAEAYGKDAIDAVKLAKN
jgi:hypothetical protein